MGSGKTSASINLMNSDTETNYIFITPYLKEVERVKEQTNKDYHEPKVYSKHGETFYKIDSLHNLIENNKNIATTHALFKMATKETKELIQSSNYTLILDEVMEVVKLLEVSSHDINMLLNDQWIINNNGIIEWNTEKEKEQGEYTGEFKTVKQLALNKNLILHRNKILIWEFPSDIFNLFKEVYILTYLFDAQIQKYYYDMNNITYEKYISTYENNQYIFKKFTDSTNDQLTRSKIKELINIYDGTLNKIGNDETALSKTWYENKRHMHKKLQNNLTNYFRNKMKTKSNFNIWTTFKDYQGKLRGQGYTKGFVSCTARATNEFKERNTLAYTINRYINPVLKDYFYSHDITINEDLFALSELLQWIWRSAIRDDKPINIYIPSRRMRNLLIKWLDNEL